MEAAVLDLELDDDGYPTEETLQQIREAPAMTREQQEALLSAVHGAWMYANGYWEVDGDTYRISTAGWSGNEDIVDALSKNHPFWVLCWESSRRGGHYTFVVRKS
jgi:hypothetical protein